MEQGRRGAGIYLVATIVSMASTALRYTLFARVLGPQQLGLAATITLTAAFFDTVTDTGSERFLIQDPSGAEPKALAMVHAIFASRGLLVAGLLALFAGPLASFYHAGDLRLGFCALAISPIFFGLQHLEPRRRQRDHDFRPESACIIAAETFSLVVTLVVLFWRRDYFAAVAAVAARTLGLAVMSHLVAKAPYVMAYDRQTAGRVFRFGGPLVFNGVSLFFGSQGERLIIASQLSVAALGTYSAISLLIFYPSSILGRYLLGIQMPIVAAARESEVQRTRSLSLIGGGTTLMAIAQTVGFAIVAPSAVVLFFGARFGQTPLIVALVGLLQASRFIRNWPTVVALGLGRSLPVLTANTVRLIAFPAAILCGRLGLGLPGLLGSFLAGEVIGAVASVVMINHGLGRSWLIDLDRLAAFALTGAMTLWTAFAWGRDGPAAALWPGLATLATLVLVLLRERAALIVGWDMAGHAVASRLALTGRGSGRPPLAPRT